jgi:hypothetical protein
LIDISQKLEQKLSLKEKELLEIKNNLSSKEKNF